VFQGYLILDDGGGNGIHRLDGDEAKPTLGRMIPSTAKPETYEYCVAGYDKKSKHLAVSNSAL
jgi:hypothetical protein